MQERTSSVKTKIVQLTLGVLIIALLFWRLDAEEIMGIFREIDLKYFISAAGAYLCYNLIMTLRVSYLLRQVGRDTDHTVFFAHMGGMLASDITPARGGYFILPYILKRSGQSDITDGMAAIVAPAGIEFILKVVGGFFGIMLLVSTTEMGRSVLISLSLAGILFLTIGSMMVITMWSKESFSATILSRIPFIGRFQENYMRLKGRSLKIKSSADVIVATSVVCWVILGLQWFLIGRSLGIDLPFYVYFLLHPLITLLAFVPLTPSGIGVMEGGAAAVFYLLGVGSGVGLAFSLLVRVNSILIDLIGLRSISTIGEVGLTPSLR
ncbi:MAG: lysylphosphatidylglycerol synthase transmembrane domain-containing protein [Halobacteriota archaeon]|nr:lysylphosphatidylglycerol synthase transmembrane domain-containing protein [Halobacteriota archaeon]